MSEKKIQLRKYLLGGAANQNDNMFATINSFLPYESGATIYVGCLPWTVVGEMPMSDAERVEVPA